ncbi:MAG: hypothetical protein METHP_01857 [Methanoregula sp. SKADARSKE-2]|nr:MAG: hypothetical protein METHP_01857 [Methanoregula sp. SKADARSKE-2]
MGPEKTGRTCQHPERGNKDLWYTGYSCPDFRKGGKNTTTRTVQRKIMRLSPVIKTVPPIVCLGVFLLFAAVFAGCTQPAQVMPVPTTEPITTTLPPYPTAAPSLVSVTKPDDSHIVVTFLGGPDMNSIHAVQATVTNSKGRSDTKHMGDSLGTTSVSPGSLITFDGTFSGSTQVSVSGFYSDGSQKIFLQTTI